MVDAETSQAAVDRGVDRRPAQALDARLGRQLHEALGRDLDLVAAGEIGQRAAHDLLAGAVGVDVGGVEGGDAGLERLLQVGPALVLGQRPRVRAAVGHAVAHAAEDDRRDGQVRGSELDRHHAPIMHP